MTIPRKKRQRDLFGKLIPPTREEKVQQAIVEFLKLAGHPRLLWWHCPNGAMETVSARVRFSKLGTLTGMSDFCFVLPGGEAAFAEVKNELGLLSEAQQAFQARCAVLSLRYAIWRSVDDAKASLSDWGGLR